MPAHLIKNARRADGLPAGPARIRLCGRTVRHCPARRSSGNAATLLFALILVPCLAGCGDDAAVAPPSAVPASIILSSSAVTLRSVGETEALSASVYDQHGRVIRGASIGWTSGDASVATVTNDGLVAAIANGTTDILATASDANATATVTVRQEVSSVSLSPAEKTLTALGDTVRLAAVAVDANGHRISDASFTWESSDPSVATVDSAGVVQAAGKGRATITAAAGSIPGAAQVTIPGPVPFDATPPPTDPTPVPPEITACRGWEEWFVGDYSYFNNVWNRQDTRDYEQCMMRRTVPGLVGRVEYGWRWRWPARRGQVKAYPEVIYGHKPWHPASTTPELPRRIDAIAALEVDYEAYLTVEGTYNLSFDFWITSDDPPSVSGITHEVMIWLDHDFRPAGQEFYVGPIRLEGALWDLYFWPDRVWFGADGEQTLLADFIALVRHRDQHVGSVDLLAIFRYLADRGYLPAHHYLTAIEFGVEAISGTGELWLKDYRVHLR